MVCRHISVVQTAGHNVLEVCISSMTTDLAVRAASHAHSSSNPPGRPCSRPGPRHRSDHHPMPVTVTRGTKVYRGASLTHDPEHATEGSAVVVIPRAPPGASTAPASGTLCRPYRDDQHLLAGDLFPRQIAHLQLLDTEQLSP